MTSNAQPCEICGTTTNTIFYPWPGRADGEYLCPEHSQQRAMIYAAEDHLLTLLNLAAREWLAHWRYTSFSPADLAQAVDSAAQKFDAMTYAERLAQVEAQLLQRQEAPRTPQENVPGQPHSAHNLPI